MKRLLWILLLATAAPAVPAQNPPDTSAEGEGAEARQLRQEIRQRWSTRVRRDLDLTDDQAAKLQATEDRFMQRRREIADAQRSVHEGLRRQLQPGVAADPDSVRRLMDAREKGRAALAQIDRDEDKEIAGYLNPVQHARYQMMREQLRRRIELIRERRQGLGPMTGSPRGLRPPHAVKPRRRM